MSINIIDLIGMYKGIIMFYNFIIVCRGGVIYIKVYNYMYELCKKKDGCFLWLIIVFMIFFLYCFMVYIVCLMMLFRLMLI